VPELGLARRSLQRPSEGLRFLPVPVFSRPANSGAAPSAVAPICQRPLAQRRPSVGVPFSKAIRGSGPTERLRTGSFRDTTKVPLRPRLVAAPRRTSDPCRAVLSLCLPQRGVNVKVAEKAGRGGTPRTRPPRLPAECLGGLYILSVVGEVKADAEVFAKKLPMSLRWSQ